MPICFFQHRSTVFIPSTSNAFIRFGYILSLYWAKRSYPSESRLGTLPAAAGAAPQEALLACHPRPRCVHRHLHPVFGFLWQRPAMQVPLVAHFVHLGRFSDNRVLIHTAINVARFTKASGDASAQHATTPVFFFFEDCLELVQFRRHLTDPFRGFARPVKTACDQVANCVSNFVKQAGLHQELVIVLLKTKLSTTGVLHPATTTFQGKREAS
eukprot:4840613-Amphidinium_carterae.2